MKTTYFREKNHHHLVVTAGAYCCHDYQMEMIRRNEIGGLLRPTARQMDAEVEYDYTITGYQSLRTFCEVGPLSAGVITVLVKGLCRVLEELERYMIDADYLTLRPEFIFLERRGELITQVKYCIFPFESAKIYEQARTLFKIMLNEVDYQEKAAVDLVYELFQSVSREEIDWEEMRLLAEMALPGKEEMVSVYPAEQSVCPAVVQSEEILWAEEAPIKTKAEIGRGKKIRGKMENTLLDCGKKSILKTIGWR